MIAKYVAALVASIAMLSSCASPPRPVKEMTAAELEEATHVNPDVSRLNEWRLRVTATVDDLDEFGHTVLYVHPELQRAVRKLEAYAQRDNVGLLDALGKALKLPLTTKRGLVRTQLSAEGRARVGRGYKLTLLCDEVRYSVRETELVDCQVEAALEPTKRSSNSGRPTWKQKLGKFWRNL